MGRNPRAWPFYDAPIPRIWLISLTIILVCIVASMVIATVKLT